jgi:glycosyltransferase involved in cell wall biosynthesis
MEKEIIRYIPQNSGGGARVHCHQLNEILEIEGYCTTTFIPEWDDCDELTSASKTKFKYINEFNDFYIFRFIFKSRNNILFLHSHLKRADILFFLLSQVFRLKHVITVHYPYFKSDSRSWVYYMHKLALKRADKVIFISKFVKDHYLKEYGIENRHGRSVVYNASEVLSYKPKDFNSINVCLVGELSKRKGIENLPLLIDKLISKDVLVNINIYGDGPCRDAVTALKSSGGVNINYHGYVRNPRLIYLNNNIILSLSVDEAFGRTVTEGLANGLVPILNNSGAFPELITHGEDGYLFNDIDELALLLSNACKDKADLIKMAEFGRNSYQEKYSLKAFKEHYLTAMALK